MRTNQAMLHLLGGDSEYYEPSVVPMPEAFVALVAEGFAEVNGCVFLSSFTSMSVSRDIKLRLVDETGLECFVNEIYVGSFLETNLGLPEIARLGCDMAFYLGREASRSGVLGSFRIIVSAQPADEELGISETGTLRFHKLRAGQAWLHNNLEGYGAEAIAVLDFIT